MEATSIPELELLQWVSSAVLTEIPEGTDKLAELFGPMANLVGKSLPYFDDTIYSR